MKSLAVAALLVGAALLLRGPLEASMALHMALQLPMIVVGGALAATGLVARAGRPRPGRVETRRAQLGRMEPERTALGGMELGSMELGRTQLGHMEPGRTALGGMELGRMEPGRTVLGRIEPGGAQLGRWDAHGLAGLTWLLLVSAYWMVPRALEQALTLPLAEVGKFASLFLAGWLLPGALARAAPVIQLFFLGNFCAMMAIAGMLYQDMPQRLCNAYTLDDQVLTGVGLVVASIGIAAAWCTWQLPALGGYAGADKRNAR